MPSYLSRKTLKDPTPLPQKTKKRSVFLRWAGRFFMAIGIFVFISMLFSFISFVSMMGGNERMKTLPDEFVLGLRLEGNLPDVSIQNELVAQFVPARTSLIDVLRSIQHAKTDDRVKALAVNIQDGGYNLTQIETLRDAILDFRQSGKKAYIITDNFGSFSSGMGEYWLASAFDEIWLQPMGIVSLTGLRLEQPYFEKALDKVGVEMQMEQRKEFKTGPEMYLRNSMSEESATAMKAVMTDIMDTMLSQMAGGRDLEVSSIKESINMSPMLAEEAMSAGLIDKIGYMDEFDDMMNAAYGKQNDEAEDSKAKEVPFVLLSRYKYEPFAHTSHEEPAKVALINIEGAILDAPQNISTSPMAFLVPEDIADANKIADAIWMAGEDDTIEVIIIRVNSPGGSPNASETIRRAIVRAREKGKYVIVSMADTAASGGYWVAVDADIILAGKLTLTGSIGVYGGKPNLSGLWDKIGVTWQALEYGQNASMWSTNVAYSESERARLSAMMDHVYAAFTSRVAQGRDIPSKEIEKVAKGRVWTGLDAQTHKLVDEIGGLESALRLAADKAEIEDWHKMRLTVLPRRDDPWEEIVDMLGLPLPTKSQVTVPQFWVPALYNDAVVFAPSIRVDF